MTDPKTVYTLAGIALLIATELLRWLAQAPPEMCTTFTALAGLLMAGGPSLIRPPDQRGHGGVGLLGILAVVALVPLLLSSSGCGSREVITREPIAIEYWQGPPCRVHILAGTDAPYIVRNPAGSPLACRVVEP